MMKPGEWKAKHGLTYSGPGPSSTAEALNWASRDLQAVLHANRALFGTGISAGPSYDELLQMAIEQHRKILAIYDSEPIEPPKRNVVIDEDGKPVMICFDATQAC